VDTREMLGVVFTDLTRSASSTAPAQWVVDALQTFGEDVRSLVPGRFDTYLRIFHPASRQPSREPVSGDPVRWDHVARANGRIGHPLMQWPSITGDWSLVHGGSQPGVWDHEPMEGSLPAEIGLVLADVLAMHTATPDRCWFAIWEGFGALPDVVRAAPRFEVPARAYFLFEGPAAAIAADVMAPFRQTANIWWPDDRSWCVATEIDLMSTYIGCSRGCADDLLARSSLEICEVPASAGIGWDSDTLNPPPRK
jgi:hypothetical protein